MSRTCLYTVLEYIQRQGNNKMLRCCAVKPIGSELRFSGNRRRTAYYAQDGFLAAPSFSPEAKKMLARIVLAGGEKSNSGTCLRSRCRRQNRYQGINVHTLVKWFSGTNARTYHISRLPARNMLWILSRSAQNLAKIAQTSLPTEQLQSTQQTTKKTI